MSLHLVSGLCNSQYEVQRDVDAHEGCHYWKIPNNARREMWKTLRVAKSTI